MKVFNRKYIYFLHLTSSLVDEGENPELIKGARAQKNGLKNTYLKI